MRAFLCGGGSGEKTKDAYEKLSDIIDKDKALLYIPIAMEYDKMDDCYNWITKELKEYNIENIEMIRTFKELENIDLSNYCAVFLGGGNTFKLLFELKLARFDDKLKEYIDSDGIVFGGSAGAIVMGKDIKPCECDDENEVGVVNTEGFDILNGFCIFCHYLNRDEEKNEANTNYLRELSNEYRIIALPEEDTIFVSEDGIEVLGDKPYYIFDTEQITKIEEKAISE